jgi:hypothetical protein
MKTKFFVKALISLVLFLFFSCRENEAQTEDYNFRVSIPTRGNSWVVNNTEKNQQIIGNQGIHNWVESSLKIRTYFKTTNTGKISLGMEVGEQQGKSKIKVTFNDKSQIINIGNRTNDTIFIGNFKAEETGYQFIEVQGLEKEGAAFPAIQSFLLGGEAVSGEVYFVKDDFYWGRRGPSVHLNYQLPENHDNIHWFYNEITVPENNDVIGSFFMANGFGEGYFGMQVNSETERRILFSVWSPYSTDNPDEIPEEYKIKMLKKGKDVYTGEFGNEGSGGQSYLRYNWKAGNTYRFLLNAAPTGNGETDYTAWFFPPEEDEWKLIASFRRPKTDTYLTRLHSFLENFMTETGYLQRRGYYSNQWFYDAKEKWTEITKMRFTTDATARKQNRMDYAGGSEADAFYLQNCGFFSKTTPIDTIFEREVSGTPPDVDFEKLP